mgnify:CR=1 FL=1
MKEFIISEAQTEKAVLVGLITPEQNEQKVKEYLDELAFLADTAGVEAVKRFYQKLDYPNSVTFVGSGKLQEIKEYVVENEIGLVIFDDELSAKQLRNIEKELQVKILDRTNLILDIFARRAQTAHAKTQVELAQYKYMLPRLTRLWTHLERQRGGVGMRGPGETQLETDKRIILDKISKLKRDLVEIDKQKSVQRKNRGKMVRVALVGYTNAGKSTLFNCLSSAGVFAENLLFATLDPTMRRIRLPGGREVILSDTVGFISDLPHELIMSFRATLEEVLEADVIVHVRDIANENSLAQKKDVLNVLKSLGLKNIENESGYIEVLNKIDLLDEAGRRYLEENAARNANVVPLSAVSGEGTERFLRLVEDKLSANFRMVEVTTDAADGKLISWIYKNTDVISAAAKGEQMILRLKADDAAISKLKNKTPVRTLG